MLQKTRERKSSQEAKASPPQSLKTIIKLPRPILSRKTELPLPCLVIFSAALEMSDQYLQTSLKKLLGFGCRYKKKLGKIS